MNHKTCEQRLGMESPTCKPSTWDAKLGDCQLEEARATEDDKGYLEQWSEILSPK